MDRQAGVAVIGFAPHRVLAWQISANWVYEADVSLP
jgi:hypothetical protein